MEPARRSLPPTRTTLSASSKGSFRLLAAQEPTESWRQCRGRPTVVGMAGVLVLNAGSSSPRYQVVEPGRTRHVSGLLEWVDESGFPAALERMQDDLGEAGISPRSLTAVKRTFPPELVPLSSVRHPSGSEPCLLCWQHEPGWNGWLPLELHPENHSGAASGSPWELTFLREGAREDPRS